RERAARPGPRRRPQAGEVALLPASELRRDAARFQYKDSDGQGVTDRLRRVGKFDPNLAGVLLVWRDPADGQTYVVNGHQRHALAQRLGYEGPLLVRYIDAPTAEAARVVGAMVNIAEGSGTPVDAAKLLRDQGLEGEAARAELERNNVPLTSAVARDGIALTTLAPELFQQVATGQMRIGRGVAIGRANLSHEQQRALLKMPGANRMSDAQLAELARFVADAGTEAVQQETLFGTETFDVSLAPEKARLSAWVKQRLAGDRRLLRTVAD